MGTGETLERDRPYLWGHPAPQKRPSLGAGPVVQTNVRSGRSWKTEL